MEQSFRMSKTDLRARIVVRRRTDRGPQEIVFTALTLDREARTARSGIGKIDPSVVPAVGAITINGGQTIHRLSTITSRRSWTL